MREIAVDILRDADRQHEPDRTHMSMDELRKHLRPLPKQLRGLNI